MLLAFGTICTHDRHQHLSTKGETTQKINNLKKVAYNSSTTLPSKAPSSAAINPPSLTRNPKFTKIANTRPIPKTVGPHFS